MKARLTWHRWLLLLPVLLVTLAMLAVACGGGEKEGANEGADTKEGGEGELFVDPNAPVVNLDLKEFSIGPSVATAKAGAVTFSAKNEGKVAHELVIVKTDAPADKLTVTNGKVDEEAAGEVVGEIEDVGPGLSVAATFDLAPGHYAFICNYEGHYQQGMHTAFTVTQ